MAHEMVANVALQLANECFESYMARSNEMYGALKARCGNDPKRARSAFVNRVAPRYLEPARVLLAKLLDQPSMPEAQKQQIMEALVLDNEFRALRHIDDAQVDYSQYAMTVH